MSEQTRERLLRELYETIQPNRMWLDLDEMQRTPWRRAVFHLIDHVESVAMEQREELEEELEKELKRSDRLERKLENAETKTEELLAKLKEADKQPHAPSALIRIKGW